MSTTVTSLDRTFIDSAVSAFKSRLAPLAAIGAVFSSQPAVLGDIVTVPLFSTGSASQDFAYSTGYVTNNFTVTGTPLTLNNWKYNTHNITDADFSKMGASNVQMIGEEFGNRLADDVVQDILSVVTSGSFSNVAANVGSAVSASAVQKVMVQADTLKWGNNRSLILNSTQHGYLSADPLLTTAFNYGNSAGLQTGEIPKVYSFNVHKVSTVPANGQNLSGIAVVPGAILIATAPPAVQPGHNYTTVTTVKDPQTGLSLGYREWYSPEKGTSYRTLELLYSYAVGRGDGIIRITSA